MPIFFILIPLLVLAGSLYYLGKRLIGPFALPPHRRKAIWIAIALWGVLMFVALFLSRMGAAWTTPLSWIGYVSLGLLSFLFFLVLLRDILLLLIRVVSKVAPRHTPRPESGSATADVDQSRRAHLRQATGVGALGVAAVLTSYGIYEARKRPGIVELTVPIPRLPAAFNGFRIVQITDVHAGLTVGRPWVERVVEEVAGLRPDMIAFTGDMVDGSVANLRDSVAPFIDLRAPHGKYFITGNHEYYSGAEEWVREIGRMGYDVLMNEHRIVERNGGRIVLAGVTDYSGGNYIPSHRSDPEAAFRNAPTDLPRIFLAHQPKTLRQSGNVQFDLMLSGHTHGGQFCPWNLLTTLDQPYLSGLHRPNGQWVYVSKGTGYWGPPVRLGARSEITVVTLVPESRPA
jgi:predicted MPP superfamily phosphohydrolase